MRKITYICNRCGKEITGTRYEVNILNVTDDARVLEDTDLCFGCLSAFADWANPPQEEPETEEEPEKEPEPAEAEEPDEDPEPAKAQAEPEKKERRKIDHGKILALRAAGWSVKDIAEEMGMDKSAVYQSLSKSKKSIDAE